MAPAGAVTPKPPKDYSAIRYLNLEGKNLKALPDYVAETKALETAKLARNPKLDFDAVCQTLAQLPSLKELTFTTDAPIPESLGLLAQLESLTLDGFTTPKVFPESVGQLRKLRSLLALGESDVTLPDSFADCVEMTDLRLRVKSWRLPERIDRLRKLGELDFTGCRLQSIPDEVAGMENVSTICFGRAEQYDYARIMPVLARMPGLRRVEFTGAAPPKEVGLLRGVGELIVWGDAETLPEELFSLTRLKQLLLIGCRFDVIPEELGTMAGLETLVLDRSEFAALPQSIGKLSKLTALVVSENPLLSSIPEGIGDLTQLRRLQLTENPELRRLPDGARRLTRLEDVRVDGHVENVPAGWSGGRLKPSATQEN